MPHVSDFTQDEDKIILDLVNYDNQTNLSKDQVAIGPVSNTVNESTVSVSAKADSGYGGAETVSYTRLDIAEFVDTVITDPIVVQQGNALKLSDFLPELNALLGTAIQPSAIVDVSFAGHEWQPNEQLEVPFAMNAFSKVYKGSFPIKVEAADIPIASVISKKVLSGLHLPGYVEGPIVYFNAPLDGSVEDETGNASVTLTGYANNQGLFETIDGRKALRVTRGNAIRFLSKAGKPKFLSQEAWKVSFEARMNNPAIFRHEPMFNLLKTVTPEVAHFGFWKRAQTGNKVIVNTFDKPAELTPMFTDPAAMVANVWRKFTLQRVAGSPNVKMFVNDVQIGEGTMRLDLACEALGVPLFSANNLFDGYMRNFIITEY